MTTTAASRLRRALGTTSARKTAINLLALGIVCLVLSLLTPRFASTDNFWNVLRQISAVLITGSAVTLLMVSGGLDLSVGGVLALSGVTAALLSESLPLPLAFLVAVLVGAGVGLLNGFLTVVIGINAVIATLGTMYVSRGSALLISNGVPVYDVPSDFKWLGTGYIGPVPVPVVAAGLCLLVFTMLERRTLLGRYSVAVGSNPTAAQLSGVPLARTRFLLYTLAGAAAGLSGCVWASRVNAGIATVGVGFEFDVIVATLLGGTSLLGGQGTVLGMAIGAVIVGVLNNGLNILGVQSFWQTVALGTILVLAVGLDAVLRKEDLALRFRRRFRDPGGVTVGV
jgi:ribose/xylose/arabinose/galactoside ABC-type transport system permease subunit